MHSVGHYAAYHNRVHQVPQQDVVDSRSWLGRQIDDIKNTNLKAFAVQIGTVAILSLGLFAIASINIALLGSGFFFLPVAVNLIGYTLLFGVAMVGGGIQSVFEAPPMLPPIQAPKTTSSSDDDDLD